MGAWYAAGLLASLLAAALLFASCPGEGEWACSSYGRTPFTPDHEEPVTFEATFVYINGTDGNGTGNGGGANSTGNMNTTINITGVQLVIGQNSSRPGSGEERYDMTAGNGSTTYRVKLGPWAPGCELTYLFEANISNGTSIRTNGSFLRIPVLIEVLWHSVYSEAAELARSLDRPLLVFAYSHWDHTSEYMQSGPFKDPRAVELSAGFICLRLDTDSDPATASKLNVSSTPGLVFLDPLTGKTIERRSGPFSNDTLVREMKYVIHKGQKPVTTGPSFPERSIMLAALGLVFIMGCALMYYYYYHRNKVER